MLVGGHFRGRFESGNLHKMVANTFFYKVLAFFIKTQI